MGHSRKGIHTELVFLLFNQNRTMKTLLVCVALVASVLGDEMEAAPEAQKVVLPALYGNPWAYPYGVHHPLTYTVPQPIQYKYVPKEVEIEVKSYQHEIEATGCVNFFGTAVPCRERRDADEEEAPKALEVPYYYTPSVYGAPLAHPYHAPLAYHHIAACPKGSFGGFLSRAGFSQRAGPVTAHSRRCP